MDKVYVIVSGEYSDWEIHGFVKTKRKAKKICEKCNCNSNQYYFIKTNEFPCSNYKKKIGYEYYFVYGNRDLAIKSISIVKMNKAGFLKTNMGI